jgi:proline iminopeptidase
MRLGLLLSLLSLTASAAAPTLKAYFAQREVPKTGGVRRLTIHTPKGDFQVWTKRFGENPRIKLLLLHGGPGATHEYFEALEGFLPPEGIEFIYYDQLGSAYSDQPTDESLWTVERYLLGHSWGGILAVEYALKYPKALKGLVISNMMMSIPQYNAYANGVLAKELDPAIVAEIRGIEAKNAAANNPRYDALLMEHFYSKHVCRLPQWPDGLNRGFGHLNKAVYTLMQGPSEFGASGRLETWDRTAALPSLTVPTLVIAGTYDTMDPAHLKWVAGQVKHGSFLLCAKGSHMSMWDDQETYGAGLVKWLKAVDAGQRSVKF